MAMATMHPNCSTLSTSDPVSTLINRAMAFRHTLSQASARLNLKDTADRVIYKEEEDEEENYEEEGVKEEDDDDDDDEDERELSIEDPRYVAEKALLQELFFPEAEKAPSDDAGTLVKCQSRIVLTFNVGKMIFCEPLVRVMESEIKLDEVDSCFLAFTVPGVRGNSFHCPEQCIYIRAVEVTTEKSVFDNQFQLFWRISPDQVISNIWREHQMLEADVEFRGKSGNTILQCHGYLSLQDVVKDTSSVLQTHMVLIGSPKYPNISWQNESLNAGNIKEEESCTQQMLLKCQQPLGILDIGLQVVHDLHDYGANIQENSNIQIKESWLYVCIYIGTSVLRMTNLNGEIKSLMLSIKSGHHSALRFISMHSDSNSCSSIPILGDVILEAPALTQGTTIYIEIWCNNGGSTRSENGGLENLCGLVKVPLSAVQCRRSRTNENMVDGNFPLWLSQNSSKKAKARVMICMGEKKQMLNVLKQTRSAVIIQRYGRRFLERIRNVRLRIKTSANEKLLAEHGITQRHVFEVTVQRAKNVPIDVLLKTDIEKKYRFAFIKYVFPGEDEPLFTHDIELGESIIFGATAHHRISLAEDQCLIDYLKKMNKYTSCLRFELWTYISALNTKRDISSDSYQYRLKMSNDLNVDIPNDKKQENRSPHMKQKKKCIGFAVLPIKDLLCPFKMTSEELSSLKITRLFNLPLTFQKWVNLSPLAMATSLIVQISYDCFELAVRHLLDDTIFSDFAISSSKLVFPVRATLDALILDMVIKDKFKLSKHPVTTKWSIRFSLFPFNQELEHSYPPVLKAWTKDLRNLQFRMNVTLDGLMIKEMQQSYMTFEVWKHVIHTQKQCSPSTPSREDFWVGVSMVPCVLLISQKKGIAKWINLSGCNKKSVGSLKISIRFSNLEK